MAPEKKFVPRVQLTKILRASLQDDGFDPDYFAQYFANWKALGSEGEFADEYFGKDGFYDRPTRNGRRVLRHVHLPPEDGSSKAVDWDVRFRRKTRKTSDTSLIYAYDPLHGFLLIFIAKEPMGHQIANMETDASRKLMNQFADVAEAFIFNGKILV